MIKAGILGGSGYMGGEALRGLLDHPEVEIAWVTSRSPGGIADHHPNLFGLDIELIHPDRATPCDVVFLALPTDVSIHEANRFLKAGCKVIDLGAAFRLSDRQTWEATYKLTHPHWELAQQAVYGISELHLAELRKTSLVANPGCFASATILGLAPLVKNNLIDTDTIIADGISGTAGAGAELARPAHHPEIGNNLVPYNVVGHRHTFEMEQELGLLAGRPVRVHFTPVYAPITRGILSICHVFPRQSMTREEILAVYKEFYRDAPFVQVYDLPREEKVSWQYKPYPWVSAIAGTNYCQIGLDIDPQRKRIVVFSVLDSIGKGGALAGIETMNIMFGFDRTAGLTRRGMHPN